MRYSDLGGRQPGGIEADGRKGAWIGVLTQKLDKWQDDRVAFPFSETGVARMDSNGQVTWYNAENSPLPSDTLLQAAPAKDGGVWLATKERRVVHFLPPDRLTWVPTVLPLHINAMKADAEGRLHVVTFGGLAVTTHPNAGLYRLEGDSLVWIGHPAQPSSIARMQDRKPRRAEGWKTWLGPGGDGLSRLDMLGRRFRFSD